MFVSRTDRISTTTAGLLPAVTTPEGFLRVDAYLYRGGVQTYRRADGTEVREYRDPDEVLAPDVLAAHRLLPLANSHPADMVRPENATATVVGAVGGDVRRDGNRARATLMVYTADAIAEIHAGKRELSVGYLCKIDATPGTSPSGERYDVRQYGWTPNHVAIEHRGRAGDAVMRVDHADEIDDPKTEPAPASAQKEDSDMDEIKKQLAEALAATAAATKRADAAEAALVLERSARLDAAGKLDGARAEVRARVKLEECVLELCPEVAPEGRTDAAGKQVADRFDGLSDRDLMVAAIKRIDGDTVGADLSDAVVQGFYLSAIKRAKQGASERDALATRYITQDGFAPPPVGSASAPKNSDQLRADQAAQRGHTIYGRGN